MEVRAVGSIEEPRLQNLLQLLTAVAGHEPAPINIHEMTMRCEGASKQEIQLRHLIVPAAASHHGNGNGTTTTTTTGADRWAVYQYNTPPWCDLKTRSTLAATVLTVTQAYCSGSDVPNFYKKLGFIQQYQHFKKGYAFDVQLSTWGVHILVSKLHRVVENNTNTSSNGGVAAGAGGGFGRNEEQEAVAGEEVVPGHVLVEVWTEVESGKTHTDAIAAVVEVGKQLAVEGVTLQPLPEKK